MVKKDNYPNTMSCYQRHLTALPNITIDRL